MGNDKRHDRHIGSEMEWNDPFLKQIIEDKKIHCDVVMLKNVETRFPSSHVVTDGGENTMTIILHLVIKTMMYTQCY